MPRNQYNQTPHPHGDQVPFRAGLENLFPELFFVARNLPKLGKGVGVGGGRKKKY